MPPKVPDFLAGVIAIALLCSMLFFFWRGMEELTAAAPPLMTPAVFVSRPQPKPIASLPEIAPLILPPLAQENHAENYSEALETGRTAPNPVAVEQSRRRFRQPVIALVIDDCGLGQHGTQAAIALPPEVTLAFLPYGRRARALSKTAAARGHDVILHMPMQPMGDEDPGPEPLTLSLSPDQVRQRVQAAFAAIPNAIGLNNHMGSRFTADAVALRPVMQEIKSRRLFFLDSVTSPRSAGSIVARQAGVPALTRDVFLDDVIAPHLIEVQLALSESLARRHGSAIAIGHPHPATLQALVKWLPTLERRGFKLVRLKELLRP